MDARTRRVGFTIIELLVAIVIMLVLISIFVPYLNSVREQSRRTGCEDHLRQIFAGLQTYAQGNGQAFPRVVRDAGKPTHWVAFTGAKDADPFSPPGVELNDVTAPLFLLVRQQLVSPNAFICPSSDDTADVPLDRLQRGNFSSRDNLSYSFAMPYSASPDYHFNSDRLRAEFVLLADRNPGRTSSSDVTTVSRNAAPLELERANSKNHGRSGQNVLYVTGTVIFQVTPYCGYLNDNIYTAQSSAASTVPSSQPADVNGVVGHDVGPSGPDDSYLVPYAGK